MTQKTIQKKNLVIFLIITLILSLIPFVYSDIQSGFYKNPDGTPVSVPSSGSPTTPSTTPPTITIPTTPSTTSSETKDPLEWIKQNAKGVNFADTKDESGKVTGTIATFQNPGGELKLKKPDGTEYSVTGIVPETQGRKAQITFNTDGNVKDIQLTVEKDSKTPLTLYIGNTKLLVPQDASISYNQELKKVDVTLRGGKLSEMPQQIDSKKKDDIKLNYKAEETTELPNGVILQKNQKGFPASTITSINGKDYISVANAARFNGATLLNYEYKEKGVNGDAEVLGLRGAVSKSDLTSGKAKSATGTYVIVDPKNGVLETGAAAKKLLSSGKVGPIIVLDKENDFLQGMVDGSVFAAQAREGGIVQIIKQGDNEHSIINTQGKFNVISGPKHNYFYKEENGETKILLNAEQGISGLNLDATDKYSAPFIMKNYDTNGKEIIEGHMIAMNSNNGFAVVPVGTTQAQLSNGDVWISSLYSRITPEGFQETPVNPTVPTSTTPNIPVPGPDTRVTPLIDPAVQPALPKEKIIDNMMSSSVRIHVQDPNGRSGGSGTIIGDDGKGNAIIATVSHTFRNSGYRGAITIDTFNPQQSGSSQGVLSRAEIPARLISYDAVNDMALVSVPKDQLGNYQSARVAPQNFRVAPGESVYSTGCSKGADCTIANQKISSLQNIIGHTTTDFVSIEGRSGGGLYSRSGFVVGVLSASRDGISYYMNLEKIRNMLDKQGLSHLYKMIFILVQFN